MALETVADLLRRLKIIPVVTINSSEEAMEVCRALQAGGIHAAEITLRTSAAFEAIKHVKKELRDFAVGAGTLKNAKDVEAVCAAGVDFAVSPGLTEGISVAAKDAKLNLLPGIATASELLMGIEAGWDCFKLFPASAVGGIPLLKAFAAPFGGIHFCPTGGIGPDNYKDYLALPNVLAIGGSWMVAPDLIKQQDWSRITELSRECMDGITS